MTSIKGLWTLTRDAELSTTPNGTPVASTGAADNVIVNKSTGEKVAVFYELVGWRELAEQLAQYKKGDFVEVEGTLLPKQWQDKQGQKRITLQVTLRSISKYQKHDAKNAPAASTPATKAAASGSKPKTATSASASAPAKNTSEQAPAHSGFVDVPDDDDELPF